jgi:hypothetical protein
MLKLLKKNEEGNAMVEFALLLPVYMILLLGAYFVGEACLVRLQLRSHSRTLAENVGGGRLATFVKPVMVSEIFFFNMRNYETESLFYEREGGGIVNYRDDPDLRPYLSWAIENGAGADNVDEDIANILVGNHHYDWIEGVWRGSMISNAHSRLGGPSKMIFSPEHGGEEFRPDEFEDDDYWWEDYPYEEGDYEPAPPDHDARLNAVTGDVYYGYFNVRAEHYLVKGGGPGIAVPTDAEPYTHPVEPVVTEKFPDNGSTRGRMPTPRYKVLIPSDAVMWPRYFKFSQDRD